MTLHDDYQTLLRRGMPEHEDVYFIGGPEWFVHSDPIAEPLARDLITMHALRWYETNKTVQIDAQCGLYDITGKASCHVGGTGGVSRGIGHDILAAILAATEHLEPVRG